MLDPPRQTVGTPLQPKFHIEHLHTGEPDLAASVRAQLHQFGRRANRRHHPVELVLAVAMAMHEPGEVANGERGLPMRDRIQRQRRVREQLLTIGAGDREMFVEPLGL